MALSRDGSTRCVMHYRFFLFNRTGGRARRDEAECSDDEAARTYARDVMERNLKLATVEVWERARLVYRVERI
jgi:hypothetical protein